MSSLATIHDRGYRRYEGPREGASRRIRALFVAGLRRALGLRRPWTAKMVPWTLIAIAIAPVLFIVASLLLGTTSADALGSPAGYLRDSTLLLLVVSAALAAELVCRDRRDRVFSLLFSRPVTPLEYLGARLGVLAAIAGAIVVIPLGVVFAAKALSAADPLAYLGDHPWEPLQIVAASAVAVLFYSAVALAVAVLFQRRGLAMVSIVALFLVAALTAETVAALSGSGWRWFALLDPAGVPQRVVDWIFGEPFEQPFVDVEPSPRALSGEANLAAAAIFVLGACALFLQRVTRAVR